MGIIKRLLKELYLYRSNKLIRAKVQASKREIEDYHRRLESMPVEYRPNIWRR